MKRVLLALVAACTMVTAAHAATADGKYVVKGAGNGSCARFHSEREKKSLVYALFAGWIEGYLSSYNEHTAKTFDIAPWQNVDLLAALLDNFCKEHPDISFKNAVDSLINALAPNRLQTASERVEADAGKNKMMLFEAVLVEVQKALAKQGYYKGKVDGQFGDGTRTAIEAYQKAEGLQVTGLPDQLTLYRLLR